MIHRAVRTLAAVGALALTGTVAGCTSHSSSTHATGARTTPGAHPSSPRVVTAAEAVRLAATKATSASSAHVIGTVTTAVPGHGVQRIRFIADEQWRPAFRMRYTTAGIPGMGGHRASFILTTHTLYLSLPPLRRQLGKPWASIPLAEVSKRSGIDLSRLFDQARQMDPTRSLRILTASGDVRRVGTGAIDGVTATHYAGTVDVAVAWRRLPADLARQLRRAAALAGFRTEHVDVWVDGADRTRRVVTSVDARTGAVRMDMRMSRYGQRVRIAAPCAAQTVDLSTFVRNQAQGT